MEKSSKKIIGIIVGVIVILCIGIIVTFAIMDDNNENTVPTVNNNTTNVTNSTNATNITSSSKETTTESYSEVEKTGGEYGYCSICGNGLTYKEATNWYTQGKVCQSCAENPYYYTEEGSKYANEKIFEKYPDYDQDDFEQDMAEKGWEYW